MSNKSEPFRQFGRQEGINGFVWQWKSKTMQQHTWKVMDSESGMPREPQAG